MEKTINNRILLGISGGIAAYKSAELVRLLRQQNDEVRVVMTQSATQFITPLTLQALSGHPVATELLDAAQENAMGHINLSRWADIMIIAPATANSIAKFSHGIADDLLSTLYLAANCPVYIAPAMNQAMWHKPITQQNIQQLENHGAHIIGPEQGIQACGETGFGRMSEAQIICQSISQKSDYSDQLKNINILISAGPTREPLDPVRFISNHSSGKMGYAIAEAALKKGAHVTLVSGPVRLTAPVGAEMIQVETAEQMYDAVISHTKQCQIFIGAAAVADYHPVNIQTAKLKKNANSLNITLQKTKDILAEVAVLPERPNFVVGFAAETNDLELYAKTKLKQKKLDMIAANWVGKEKGGFEKDENELFVFWNGGSKCLPMTNKKHLAEQLLTLITEKLNEKNTV